nr:peptidoglycan binding domain-containing protein [Streptomyces sp. MMG1533]
MASDDGPDAGRSAAQPEERKTETTLTTRIRINIPGSRPIPPVVMRQTVTGAEVADDGPDAEAPTPGATAPPAESPAEPAPSAEEKTSDWFAPRKSGPAKGSPGGGSTNGAGLPGGSGASAGAGGADTGAAAPGGTRPGGARPGGVVGSMSAPGGSRPGGTNGSGLPGGATGGPVAPGHGGGTGSFDVTEALSAGGPQTGGSRPGPGRDDLPYFSENDGGQNGKSGQSALSGYDSDLSGYGGQSGPNGQSPYGGPGGPSGFNGPNGPGGSGGPGGSQGPAGPTGGPVTGDGPMAPPAGGVSDTLGASYDFNGPDGIGGPGGPGSPQGPGGPRGPGGPAGPGGPSGVRGPGGPGGPGSPQAFGGPTGPGGSPALGGPTGPGGSPAHGGPTGPGGSPALGGPTGPGGSPPFGGPTGPGGTPALGGLGPGGGMSDDTAILTPQKPAPEPGGHGFGGASDNVSGHTVTSGIPVVPSDRNGAFPPGAHTDAPVPPTTPKPESGKAAGAAASKKAKKKGRSKLALLGTGVIVIAAGAYGAGLLMNSSDVPKGTTVLGVDIGGGTRDDAVEKLNKAFDGRVSKDLKLTVDGKTVTLKPEQAGLQFDMAATVSAAANSDYNPVSVIGSLFGNHRVVDPVMPVDEEKLQAELQDTAGGTGSATDGTIEFKSGKAVAVYGKAGKGIDVAKSTAAVEEAYRAQVETGTAPSVTLPTTTKQPTVSNAEVDRMMKEFAKPAMSELATVQTDATHSINFGSLSLPKILGFKAVGGKLVETYDLDALKAAYGTTFEGVKIDGASGKRDVLPQDVASALGKALRGKTTAERTVVIDTTPN